MINVLSDQVIGHYEKHAFAWYRDRQSSARSGIWNDKGWHGRFIGRLGRGATVLDLGCGPGRPVAQNLADQGLHATGVDASPTMISLCRERLPDHDWIVADMRGLTLGRHFDGILAWDSFFHLNHDDQRLMFAVFADHALTGAWLMFNTGPQHDEAIGEYRGDTLYHASLSPAEHAALAGTSAFEVIEHVANDPAAGGRTAWLCRRRQPE